MHIVTASDFLSTYALRRVGEKNLSNAVSRSWLPLEASQQIAETVADLLADGHLAGRATNGRMHCGYISFFSDERNELESFNRRLKALFGVSGAIRKWGRRFNGRSTGVILCNSALERILALCGVPLGGKASAAFEVPGWLQQADRNTKAAFLRRLFNCDGTIGYDRRHKRWFIRFETTKLASLEGNGRRFIAQLQGMLREFGIDSIMTRSASRQFGSGMAGAKIVLAIKIYKPKAVTNFSRFIGFDSERKKQRLLKAKEWAKCSDGCPKRISLGGRRH
jgi:intein/homing endonuclease